MTTERGDHAFIFLSILYGFSVAKLFECWSDLLTLRLLADLLSPPGILSIGLSCLLLWVWWSSYNVRTAIGKNIGRFSLAVLETLLFYVMAAALSSVFRSNGPVFDAFLETRFLIYTAGAALGLTFVLGNVRTRTRRANAVRLAAIGLLLVGWIWPAYVVQLLLSLVVTAVVLTYAVGAESGWFGDVSDRERTLAD